MSVPTTERGGIIQAIRALVTDGWTMHSVDDGGGFVRVYGETDAINVIMGVDEATLSVVKDGKNYGCVLFVLGNSPEEVICDYTVNLDILDKLIDSWI